MPAVRPVGGSPTCSVPTSLGYENLVVFQPQTLTTYRVFEINGLHTLSTRQRDQCEESCPPEDEKKRKKIGEKKEAISINGAIQWLFWILIDLGLGSGVRVSYVRLVVRGDPSYRFLGEAATLPCHGHT